MKNLTTHQLVLKSLMIIGIAVGVCPSVTLAQSKTSLKNAVHSQGGILVVLGENMGRQAVELAKSSRLTIYVQSDDPKDVAATRKLAYDANLLGSRIYVDRGYGKRVHLADNLANAIVVSTQGGYTNRYPKNELLRVVQPRGRVIVGTDTTVKPVPAGTGEWTHPYHGADNNPQSEDKLARAPYLTQFLTTPWYGPMPEVTVSSGGRIFKAFGHLAFKPREWPMVGKLVALDAYNGSQLWQRDLSPGFMIHRSTIVATADTLYLADHQSCKLIDAATGEITDEIIVPQGLADGPVWKWMTLRDGILYALVGEKEKLHVAHRGTRTKTGWPWATVRSTYGKYDSTWGFGRTLLAMEVKTKKVLWSHQEKEKIDSRGVCMNSNRIFLYSYKKFLTAIDATNGKPVWKSSDAELLNLIGEHDPAQTARLGYSTSAYVKCNEKALYFAGPQRKKLVAVSAENGKPLWNYDDGNVQLVLRDDAVFAMGRMINSKKYDLLTGKVLADLKCFRGNCTRATGAADSIFARGYRHSGTLRFDVAYGKPRRLPSMRPACQDGVIIANGLLYWGPWMCDCNHSLVGVISLGAAGEFEFGQPATNEARLEQAPKFDQVAALDIHENDWPTYRGSNVRTAASTVAIPEQISLNWQSSLAKDASPTAPVTAGGMVFTAGTDGVVKAIDTNNGATRWTAFTGGRIFFPPTVADGRVLVGSADGWIYAFEATSGRRLWRFRAAPIERKIPVYGSLSSTWPVASGVMVEDGVAYAAAGIAGHDGTHVYALDAKTGKLKWQNNKSGSLLGEHEVVGVAVQGHMLLHDSKVHMAGGNVVSPGIYDSATGACLNKLEEQPEKTLDDHWKKQRASRGSELFVIEDKVAVAGRMLYSSRMRGPSSRYNAQYLLQASAGDVIIQGTDRMMLRVDPNGGDDGKPKVLWKDSSFEKTHGVVLTKNAVLVIGTARSSDPDSDPLPMLKAINPSDGKALWMQPLPSETANWGIAVDHAGRILVTLYDGQILCFGA